MMPKRSDEDFQKLPKWLRALWAENPRLARQAEEGLEKMKNCRNCFHFQPVSIFGAFECFHEQDCVRDISLNEKGLPDLWEEKR